MTQPSLDHTRYGDWCETCADHGQRRPVRFPLRIDSDGKAYYRCGWCGHQWTCWWAVDDDGEIDPWAPMGEPDDGKIVTFRETVRLGVEASRLLERRVTDDEVIRLADELEKLRVGPAMAELWTAGKVSFVVRDGELVAFQREAA